jgi:Catalase
MHAVKLVRIVYVLKLFDALANLYHYIAYCIHMIALHNRHRLGPNHEQIPVNRPLQFPPSNYQRDGESTIDNQV